MIDGRISTVDIAQNGISFDFDKFKVEKNENEVELGKLDYNDLYQVKISTVGLVAQGTPITSIKQIPIQLDTIPENYLSGSKILDNSISSSKIANYLSATKIGDGSVDNTEFIYLNGVTSNIQSQLDNRVQKSGDIMEGFLFLYDNPTLPFHAATKEYVDTSMMTGASLGVQHSIKTVTADYTVLTTDYTVLVECSVADITITLPPASDFYNSVLDIGSVFNFKKMDATPFFMILQADGVETIDGANTQTTDAQYTIIPIQSDGTKWIIL